MAVVKFVVMLIIFWNRMITFILCLFFVVLTIKLGNDYTAEMHFVSCE